MDFMVIVVTAAAIESQAKRVREARFEPTFRDDCIIFLSGILKLPEELYPAQTNPHPRK
jgi:hypothetical protein